MIASPPAPWPADAPPAVWRVAAACRELATPAWLDPTYWPTAQAVGQGGRGAAWFVDTPLGPAVLRHYRRGGLAARVSRRRFLWLGAARVRSAREFDLLRAMHTEGLPVPEPLAAAAWRAGIGYAAALLMRRIAPAEDFHARVQRQGVDAPWAAVGRGIAAFHRAGYRHADLNAFNVLIGEHDAVSVIDWDRGRRVTPARGWQAAVLDRLARGLRKHRGAVADAVIADGMARLREAHEEALG